MNHPFHQYLVCRNDYFENTELIIDIAERQEYNRAVHYPGLRSNNILISDDVETKEFAVEFANRISVDVFPGIEKYNIFLCFHKNEDYKDKILNQGWIHSDESLLAGLVYLNPGEENIESGTSIFTGTDDVGAHDDRLRSEFNLTGKSSEEYVKSLEKNWSYFKETIKIGNKFNRLIGYDSTMFHRPNSYATLDGSTRLSLLFFIYNFEYHK